MPDRVGVVLPGAGYTLAHPLMHYAALALSEAGLRVVRIDYGSAKTLDEVLAETPKKIVDAVAGADEVVLVGKSLGTAVIAQLLSEPGPLPPISAIAWLTPGLDDARFAVMQGFEGPAVAVIGTADPFYDAERLQRLPASTEVVVLDGADHALEVDGEVQASLAALRRTVDALSALCARVQPA